MRGSGYRRPVNLADLFKRFSLLPEPEEGFPDSNFLEIFSDAGSAELRTLSIADVPEDWNDEDVSNAAVHAYRLLAMRGDPKDVEHFMKMLMVWEDSFVAEFFCEESDWVMEQLGGSLTDAQVEIANGRRLSLFSQSIGERPPRQR